MGPGTKWQWTEARHGFSNMDFHSPRLTYKPQLTIWQKQRPILSPSCGAIPWGNQPATREQIDYTGLLPLCKRQCFVLTGTDIYSAYELASSKHNASAKTTIGGLTECLIYYHSILHNIASDQGSLQQIKRNNEPILMIFIHLTTFPTTLEKLVW